ncbi:zonular occludens toxin domain-containing protein [Oceanobacter kriegii]|uniref:zonular occludens toxin domain-containing protein n=1 Tax=Oceanobacter kriegii TaxID=64972 RepID=UPI000415BA40|nr:zonular occludens toxin domain-containing protein [Oceanobacter kriegii]
MSITSYTGLPGHGKSYSVVAYSIIPALRAGKNVFTNIPLNRDSEILADHGERIHQFDIQDLLNDESWFQSVFVPGSLLVIDECWRLWPAGMAASKMLQSHKSFLAEHRHMVGDDGNSTEVVLVTQGLEQLAKFPRDLVERTYLHRKWSKGRSRVGIYGGAATGLKPPRTQLLESRQIAFKKEVFKAYQSHTKSSSGGPGDESTSDSRGSSLLKSPRVLIPFAMFVVVAIYLGSTFPDRIAALSGKKERETVAMEPVDTLSVPASQKKNVGAAHSLLSSKFDIVWNNGRRPFIDYIFRAKIAGGFADLTVSDLEALGFVVEPVGQCLVFITFGSQSTEATCSHADDEGSGLIPIEV